MSIKIASINIRFENIADGEHNWPNRLPQLSLFINQLNLDLLGTQEGRKNQIYSLKNELNMQIIDSHRDWIDIRMYPTIFYNQKNIEILNSGDIWLSNTPNIPGSSDFQSSFPRLATWATAHYKILKQQFLIINVHLDHVLSQTRIKQAEVLINEIKKINKQNLKIILMGDFNESPDSELHQNLLTELDLIDHWEKSNQPEQTSHHGFSGKINEGHRIDWILTSSQLSCEKIYFENNKFNNLYLSDHFPLVATLIPS